MKPERLSLEELIQRYTVLQPPPNRFTLYAWREALGLAPEAARESQEHAFWFFHEVQKFLAASERNHRGINRLLLQSRRDPEPVSEGMIEACRAWLGAHAVKVEREILPAQGFSQAYGLQTPEDPEGGCRVWERGEERLFVMDDRSGWAYGLSAMSPEDWIEFKAGIEIDDRYALLCELIEILNALAERDPSTPSLLHYEGEDGRLTQERLDWATGDEPDQLGYPFPDYLDYLLIGMEERELDIGFTDTPMVEAFLDEITSLSWEDLGPRLAEERRRLGL